MHRLVDVGVRFAGVWMALLLATASCQRQKASAKAGASQADHQAAVKALKAHLEKGELPAAEALAAKLAGSPVHGDVLFAIGEHLEAKDDPRAFATLGQAVDHLSAAGKHKQAAAAARLQSRSAWSAVRYQDALAALDRCLVEADKAGDTTQSSRALMNLFLILYELNDLTGARRALDDAARKGASAGPPIPALLAFNRGMLAQAEGHPAVARASFQQVLQLSASAPKSEFAWNSHLNLLTLALEAGDLPAARQAHAAARPLFEQAFSKRASSRVAWGLHTARLALLEKQPQQALAALTALEVDKPDVRQAWRIAHERGRALRLLGKTREAIASFRQAADIVDGLRADQFDDFKSWVVAKRQEPFVALFELHAARGETREAWTVLERTQGRTFLEAFAASTAQAAQGRSRGEVSQRFDALKRLYPILRASPVLADAPTDQLAQGLRGDHLVAFFEGAERLFVLAVAGGRPRVLPGPSLAELRPLVAGFLERPADRTRAEALGAALFPRGSLPAPGGRLGGRLYLAPSALLARLPFAAVTRQGRYLVQDFALAQVPSGRALLALKRRPAGAGAPPLVLADAGGDLPQAAVEGREVADRLSKLGKPGTTPRLLVGPAARSERLREGPSPGTLHLALHSGVGPTGPWLGLADRQVLASELIDWKVGAGADLVVLASCASAVTRDPGLWGSLASAFLAAGSRSVVASLWSTPDTVSRALVSRLYEAEALRDPLAALAAAQRAQIAAGRPAAEWAGFAFYGTGPAPAAGDADDPALLSRSPSEKGKSP